MANNVYDGDVQANEEVKDTTEKRGLWSRKWKYFVKVTKKVAGASVLNCLLT